MENRIEHPLPEGTRIEFKSDNLFKIGTVSDYNSYGFNYVYDVVDNKGRHYKVREGDIFAVLNPQTNKNEDIGDNVHQATKEMVNHPAHYGGDNPLEVIKIIDHYKLPFSLGNTIKYVLRSDSKGNKLEDLKKAAWYLQHEINKLENV
jgi:hypothetical protein